MPNFVGVWNTTRYSHNDPENPEAIVLTITADAQPGAFDGTYARPGPDATLFGTVDGTGIVWTAQLSEPHVGDQGTAVFFISADDNTLYGAWTSQQHPSGPQPWFGTRA